MRGSGGKKGRNGNGCSCVKPGEEFPWCACMPCINSQANNKESPPRSPRWWGSPSCMGTFVDRRGVTSCERSLVGVSDLIQGSHVFTCDCCKGASWIPGKGCKFYTRDIQHHWFSQWWGASQGHRSNTQLNAHIPVQGLCPSHPSYRDRDQEHPIPKTALLDLWTALTLQNPFFWENKTPVYYLLTALVLFLKILKKKWNPFSWWNIKQNSGLQSQLSCLTLVAFPPLASQFRRRDCLGCMQLPQPGPLCLGTLWPAWKYPTCWSFMKNNSSQVSNMSVVLPILMEEVFSLIQMTHSTFPLSRPIHLVGDNYKPVPHSVLNSGTFNDYQDITGGLKELGV